MKNEKCPKCGFGLVDNNYCVRCGYIKNINLHNLLTNGIGCPRCGDGISFANKFVFNLLQQCNVEFENEKRFDWSNGKIYDIYLQMSEDFTCGIY